MKHLTKILKALSDGNRLRILKMLEAKPLCVCEINEVLGLAVSTTSNHLSILKEAGLIFEQKESKWVNNYLNRVTQQQYAQELLPLLQTWLNDDRTIKDDRKKAGSVNRLELCKG